MSSYASEENEKMKNIELLEPLLVWLIETVSLIDYYTDVMILYGLLQSSHTMWFSIIIFCLTSPFYAQFTSLMSYQIKSIRKNLKQD